MRDRCDKDIACLAPSAFSQLSAAARQDLDGAGVLVDVPMRAAPLNIGCREDIVENTGDGFGEAGFAVLVQGYLRLQQVSQNGRSQIASLMIPGDLVEAAHKRQGRLLLEAATPARLCMIRSDKAARLLLRHPSIGRCLSELRMLKLARARWHSDALARLSAEERIICFLVLATRWMPYAPLSANAGLLTLDLPRQDMANFLASSVETISRVLVRLDREGLVEIRGPQSFVLRDLNALCTAGRMAPDWRRLRFSRPLAASAADRSDGMAGVDVPAASLRQPDHCTIRKIPAGIATRQ